MKQFGVALFVAVILTSCLLLTGCGDKPKDGAPTPTASSPKINMQDGQWEITTTTEMQGMPAGMMKPHTSTACLTQKDPVAKQKDMPAECKMQDLKTVGNTVTWAVACPDTTSKGSITYSGTTYDGQIESKIKVEGKEMVSKVTMKGKYVGPCPAPAQK